MRREIVRALISLCFDDATDLTTVCAYPNEMQADELTCHLQRVANIESAWKFTGRHVRSMQLAFWE